MYDAGFWGVEKDESEAVKWYRKAAEQGLAVAQYNLGMCYALGRGVDKDEVEGGKWIRKAVDQGDADGQTILGRMYRDGFEGVKKDEAEAATWFRKAAEQGHAVAQYELGKVYDKGIHGEKNMTEAVIWYLKAAEQGKYELGDGRYKKVCKRLAHCYLFGEGVPKNVLIAPVWSRPTVRPPVTPAAIRIAAILLPYLIFFHFWLRMNIMMIAAAPRTTATPIRMICHIL